MKILRNKGEGYYLYDNRLLVKPNGEVEEKLPQLPLSDIAILRYDKVENLKKDYPGIKDYYDYQIIELFMNKSMINLNYFESYELVAFDSVFCFKINYNSKKKWTNNPEYMPVPLIALILNISEERTLNLIKLKEEVCTDDNGINYISDIDFQDFYDCILHNIEIGGNIHIYQKENQISILIERELTNNTKNDE